MKKALLLVLGLLLLLAPLGALGEEPETVPAVPPEEVVAFVQDTIACLAAEETEPWAKFILTQGATEIIPATEDYDVSKGKPLAVSLLLKSGNPRLSELPEATGDPAPALESIRQAMLANADTEAKLSVTIAPTEGGGFVYSLSEKNKAAFLKSVYAAAKKTSAAFESKRMTALLKDYFIPSPIADAKGFTSFADATLTEAYQAYLSRSELDRDVPYLPMLLYTLREIKLDASGGPEALRLTYFTPDVPSMFIGIRLDAEESLLYDPRAKDYDMESLKALMVPGLERYAMDYMADGSPELADDYTFNFMALPKDVSVFDWVRHGVSREAMDDLSGSAASFLLGYAAGLPDYPAVRPPEKGAVLSGPDSGTKLVFKNENAQMGMCVVAYASGSDSRYLVAYAPPSSTVNIHLPQGQFTLYLGSGNIWYGTQYLFGENGGYYYIDQEVPSTRYYVLFKLDLSKYTPDSDLSDIP